MQVNGKVGLSPWNSGFHKLWKDSQGVPGLQETAQSCKAVLNQLPIAKLKMEE